MRTLAELHRIIEKRSIPEPNTGCFLWTGAVGTPRGYAILSTKEGSHKRVTRLLLAATLGRELGPKEYACHRCDNPWCVNIDHLFVGSPDENMKDAKKKGRVLGPRKLTPAQVRHIRERLALGVMAERLAEEFGVSPCTISHIASGRTWRHPDFAARQVPN